MDALKSIANMANLSLAIVAIGLVAIFIWIVSKNPMNREVVFSYTALIAAFILFSLNVYLSLQTKDVTSTIKSRFIADRNGFHIYGKQHCTKVPNLIDLKLSGEKFDESSANKIFGFYNDSNQESREKIITDHMKFCVTSLLVNEMPDWNFKEEVYFSSGTMSYRNSEDNDKSSKYISIKKVYEELKLPKCYEEIIDYYRPVEGLHLPQDSEIYMLGNSIIIKNPWLKMKLETSISSSSVSNFSNDTFKDGIRYCEGGDLIGVEHDVNLKVLCHFHKLRSGNKNRENIEIWASNIISMLSKNLKAEREHRI